MRFRRHGDDSRIGECRIREETTGLMIGRKRCSTHRQAWDGDGPCPSVTMQEERLARYPEIGVLQGPGTVDVDPVAFGGVVRVGVQNDSGGKVKAIFLTPRESERVGRLLLDHARKARKQ